MDVAAARRDDDALLGEDELQQLQCAPRAVALHELAHWHVLHDAAVVLVHDVCHRLLLLLFLLLFLLLLLLGDERVVKVDEDLGLKVALGKEALGDGEQALVVRLEERLAQEETHALLHGVARDLARLCGRGRRAHARRVDLLEAHDAVHGRHRLRVVLRREDEEDRVLVGHVHAVYRVHHETDDKKRSCVPVCVSDGGEWGKEQTRHSKERDEVERIVPLLLLAQRRVRKLDLCQADVSGWCRVHQCVCVCVQAQQTLLPSLWWNSTTRMWKNSVVALIPSSLSLLQRKKKTPPQQSKAQSKHSTHPHETTE